MIFLRPSALPPPHPPKKSRAASMYIWYILTLLRCLLSYLFKGQIPFGTARNNQVAL